MASTTFELVYNGAGLNAPANNLVYFPGPTGTITGVRVRLANGNCVGTTTFNLAKNGSNQLTTELSFTNDDEKDSGTLSIASTNDDTFAINLTAFPATSITDPPYFFYITVDDGLDAYLATNVTYNNTDTLASTALSVNVESGGIYDIDLTVHSTSAVKSLNLDFGGTATATNFVGQWYSYEENAAPSSLNKGQRVTSFGTDYTNTDLDGVDGFYTFKGSIEVNAGGTFLLRGAQNAADMSDTKILRGSTLILTKLN